MGTNSKIEYVNHSLNFWIGCTPVSAGCDNCYAHSGMKMYGKDPTVVTRTSRAIWRQPLVKERATGNYKWKLGDKIFVCSWSDFFHKDADKWRTEAWDLMRKRPDLNWVIVTKRIERAAHWIPLNWDWSNRTLIVTCENQKKADERMPQLLKLRGLFPNLTLGVSLEPLLGSTDIFIAQKRERLACAVAGRPTTHLDNPTPLPDWVIVGAETGPKARYCPIEWIESIVEQCKAAGVLCFVKAVHLGTPEKFKISKDMSEWPASVRYRELPYESKRTQKDID